MVGIRFTDGAENIQKTVCELLTKSNIEFELSDRPQYVFCSVFGMEHLKYDCIKIWWTGENVRPDFNLYDYAMGFDYLCFGDRYVRAPLYLFYRRDHELALNKHRTITEDMSKRKFCNFVYSNKNAAEKRTEIFEALSSYKKVDSGGRYLNNIGGSVEDKLEFQKQYKFSIAVENSMTPGYTTEKIVQAFAAGTVPIYWGNESIGDEFDENAFVNCHRFSNLNDLVEEIKRIDNDDELYMKMLCTPAAREEQIKDNSLIKVEEFLKSIFMRDYDAAIRIHESAWKDQAFRRQKMMDQLDKHRIIKRFIEKF